MNVVVIPCFDRPDFLSVCLELIQKAIGSEKNLYLFQVDFGHDVEVLSVIEKFPLNKQIEITKFHKFKNKQSFNVIEGYKNALKHNPKTITLIEDDVFVANDFFIWHEKNIGDNFASIATKNHNASRKAENDLLASYTMSEYQSLGVCFPASSVSEICNEATNLFFTNPAGFMKSRFPNSTIGHFYAEQDGLIRRLIHEKKYNVIYPEIPRAFHAGFYGKSRGDKLTGTLEQRIEKVKLTAFDPSIMKGDSEPVLLVNPII